MIKPGYALPTIDHAAWLLQQIAEPNVILQLDAYHCFVSGVDPVAAFHRHSEHIGHIQIADPNDRGEPSDPRLLAFLKALEDADWEQWIGAEYWPREATTAGIFWMKRFGHCVNS